MNSFSKRENLTPNRPAARVGVIGAGKFASMFLTQARLTESVHVVAVADLFPERAHAALKRTGWPEEQYAARSFADALSTGRTYVTDASEDVIADPGIDIIIEITGDPVVGTHHAVRSIDAGKHIIMVNVEADCLVGPMLAKRAASAGVVYSLAYGDQPALICELVDWARTCGFSIVCAGKGTKYLPEFHASTPETVWDYYGFSQAKVDAGDYNPKMFNSFLDGTKSAIEMAAVANATGLTPPVGGLSFPPCGYDVLASTLCDRPRGGVLDHVGTVEVISSLNRDGAEIPRHLRWGVFVTFEAETQYARDCFAEYGVQTDASGSVAALFRPYHLIGLELGVSVAAIASRGQATGTPQDFVADVVTTAKRDLAAGEILDGEGGYTVYGKLTTAVASVTREALPLGLARGCRLRTSIAAGTSVRWQDVDLAEIGTAVRLRREMEAGIRDAGSAGARLDGPVARSGG